MRDVTRKLANGKTQERTKEAGEWARKTWGETFIFFPGGLLLTHGTRENVPPTVTEAGIRAKESFPLILSIFSAEQEAGTAVERKNGGEGNDGRYMKEEKYKGSSLGQRENK